MRNIVLITLEGLRADHCSFMGYGREDTPTLDRMVKEGMYFERNGLHKLKGMVISAKVFLKYMRGKR